MIEAGTAPEVIVEMIEHGADLPNDFIYSKAIRSDIKEQLLLDQDIIGNSSDIPTFILAFHRPQLMKALTEYMPTEVLTAAIKYHRPEYVLPAIEAGADVNAMTSEPRKKDQVPLITFAAKYLDPQTLKYLIAAGAKMPDNQADSPLLAAWKVGHTENIAVLQKNGMDFKPLVPEMFKILMTEYEHPLLQSVLCTQTKFAIEQGLDVNQTDASGVTLLQQAITYHAEEVVKMLLKSNADTNITIGREKKPLLVFAIQEGSPETVEVLLKHGLNPNQVFDGKSLLEIAQGKNYRSEESETIKVLKKHGAVLMPTTDFSGLSAKRRTELFMEEIEKEKHNVFKMEALLKSGLSAKVLSGNKSMLSLAIQKGKWDVLEMLLKNKADSNETGTYMASDYDHPDKTEMPILLYAIKRRSPKAVELLLKYGADPNAMVNGESILELAQKRESYYYSSEREEIVKLLEKNGAQMYPSLDFSNLTEERRSELFCGECERKEYNEDKLMALIEQGIDIHHRVRGTGGQRMDDGQKWTWISRLFDYGMGTNNPKVVQALLDQPGVESELYSGYQACHWGYNYAAWLYDIFDDLYKNADRYDKVLPLILASPKLTDYAMLKKGFEYLAQ